MTAPGRRLRDARESLGLTRVAVASAAGVSRDTLASVEDEKKGYHSATIHKIEKALRELGADLAPVTEAPAPPVAGQVTFTATFASRPDLTICVEGPVAALDQLADSMARLCAALDPAAEARAS